MHVVPGSEKEGFNQGYGGSRSGRVDWSRYSPEQNDLGFLARIGK